MKKKFTFEQLQSIVFTFLINLLIFFSNCSFDQDPKIFFTYSLLQNNDSLLNAKYSISGSITGLAGSGLVIQNNGADNTSIPGNGTFTFSTQLSANSTYSVTVLINPSLPAQTCTVTNGTGVVATSNITNVAISCSTTVNASVTTPSALTYSSSNYTFKQNTAITTITPSVTGTVTSCSASPSLPTGLAINNTTCAISGTPTINQGSTSYTITASNAGGSTTATFSITVQTTVYKIFVTASTFNGDLKTAGGGANGALGADNLCNADANKPNASNYKAILYESVNRTAIPTLNWVLVANTTYVRASDSALISTTNAASNFTFGTLTNSFGSGVQQEYWVGFRGVGFEWQNGNFRCNEWTDGTTGFTGRYGVSDVTDYTSISSGAIQPTCDNLKRLLCAEQ